MTIEHRQRSSSSLPNTSERANRRGPPPPLSTNRNNLSALSPPNTLLTPLSGTNPQYSLLSPGGAARSTSPRGRAHTVADPNLLQRQHSYVQHSAMSFYPPPPPPPQQTSNPGSHIRLPGPPPRPTTSQNHGGMPMPGYWNPPPGQYQQQMQQGYNPSLYPHPSYPLPPPPSVRPPQQQQQQPREPLTSATYVPDGASFGPGKCYARLCLNRRADKVPRGRHTTSDQSQRLQRCPILRQQLRPAEQRKCDQQLLQHPRQRAERAVWRKRRLPRPSNPEQPRPPEHSQQHIDW